MARPPAIERRTSSGGVIFRLGTDQSGNPDDIVEVALVLVRGGKTWCLPKGIIDKNEDPPATALREVKEETGLRGEISGRIGQISYWYFLKDESTRVHKTVHFYLLQYLEGSTEDHDHEVDEARWFPVDDALRKLSYRSEKQIMQKAKAMIEKKISLQS